MFNISLLATFKTQSPSGFCLILKRDVMEVISSTFFCATYKETDGIEHRSCLKGFKIVATCKIYIIIINYLLVRGFAFFVWYFRQV